MLPHPETAIRGSFINCSKGAAKRIGIPASVLGADPAQQIFLAWSDPKSPQNAYLVVETEGPAAPDGAPGEPVLRGIVMEKRKGAGKGGARMCQLCLTLHPASGVAMVSIPTTKSSKENYSTIGGYICTDLACVEYTLGTKKPEGIRQMEETLTPEQRAARTLQNAQRLIGNVAEKLG